MKNTINLTVVFALGLFLILGCGNLANKNTQTSAPASSPVIKTESTQTTAPSKSSETPSAESGGVTMANFNKIKTGMRYEEVVKILGKEGEVLSESEFGGHRTVMYKWDGDAGWGANMNAMFQNGKLNSKSQFGLK